MTRPVVSEPPPPYSAANSPSNTTVQRDCPRAACRAFGAQCDERRVLVSPASRCTRNAPLTAWADLPMAGQP